MLRVISLASASRRVFDEATPCLRGTLPPSCLFGSRAKSHRERHPAHARMHSALQMLTRERFPRSIDGPSRRIAQVPSGSPSAADPLAALLARLLSSPTSFLGLGVLNAWPQDAFA